MEFKLKVETSSKFSHKNICRTCLKLDQNSENIYIKSNEQILKELRSFVDVEVCYDFLSFSIFEKSLIYFLSHRMNQPISFLYICAKNV